MFAQRYGLDLLSIGGVMRRILEEQEHSDLSVQMKKHLNQGLVVPDELAIQCLEKVLMSLVCSTQGCVNENLTTQCTTMDPFKYFFHSPDCVCYCMCSVIDC